MKCLLDTHAFLWFVLDDSKLSSTARSIVEDVSNTVFVSPASYWEIAIKVSYQRLELFTDFENFMEVGITGNAFRILPIEVKHVSQIVTMPFHHRDPFDRVIAAQALQESIPLVSTDHIFDAYGVTRLW